MNIHPGLVAQHPGNRHGVAVNGERVDELLQQVFQHFDEEEASHGAVAVQEIPNARSILDYNQKKARGDAKIAAVPEQPIPYGSLGSSHINQVLRNILGGSRSELVPEAVDAEGRLSLKRITYLDAALADVCG
ncbi:MAG: hypothetical protein GY772_30185, partial [bacterium]|nr:hypothetical protein [bacterium]